MAVAACAVPVPVEPPVPPLGSVIRLHVYQTVLTNNAVLTAVAGCAVVVPMVLCAKRGVRVQAVLRAASVRHVAPTVVVGTAAHVLPVKSAIVSGAVKRSVRLSVRESSVDPMVAMVLVAPVPKAPHVQRVVNVWSFVRPIAAVRSAVQTVVVVAAVPVRWDKVVVMLAPVHLVRARQTVAGKNVVRMAVVNYVGSVQTMPSAMKAQAFVRRSAYLHVIGNNAALMGVAGLVEPVTSD